jgi:hypothetical protein
MWLEGPRSSCCMFPLSGFPRYAARSRGCVCLIWPPRWVRASLGKLQHSCGKVSTGRQSETTLLPVDLANVANVANMANTADYLEGRSEQSLVCAGAQS